MTHSVPTRRSSVLSRFGAPASSVILGNRFTEPTVRALPLDQYQVLAFATHGLLPGELDCLSEPSLLTSYAGTGQQGDDGLLTYSEIRSEERRGGKERSSTSRSRGSQYQSKKKTRDK